MWGWIADLIYLRHLNCWIWLFVFILILLKQWLWQPGGWSRLDVFYGISIGIDLPDDLIHANNTLDLLFCLVFCSLWIVCPSSTIWELEEVIVGIWVPSKCDWNKKATPNFLLIVKDYQLHQNKTNENSNKCKICLLFEKVIGTTVHVNA